MPGKTQQIFYFGLDFGQAYFVDTPGYGFARIQMSEKEEFKKLMGKYLSFSNK
jgi:GTP-binding protein